MIKFFVKDKLSDASLLIQTVLKSIYVSLMASMFFVSLSLLFSDTPKLSYIGVIILITTLYWFSSSFFANKNLRGIDNKAENEINAVDYIPDKLMNDLRILRAREREFDEDFSLGFMLYAIDIKGIKKAFERLDVSFDEFGDKIYEAFEFGDKEREKRDESTFKEVLISAASEAFSFGEKEVTVFDVFMGVLESGGKKAKDIFKMFGIRKEDLRSAEIFERVNNNLFSGRIKHFADRFISGKKTFKRFFTPFELKTFKDSLTDITREVKGGDVGFMIGHNREMESLREKIFNKKNTGVILVGSEGSGKNSIVSNFAYSMIYNEMPLRDRRRIYKISIDDFFSENEEEMALRMEGFLKETRKHKKIVFYIPNVSSLINIKNGKIFSAMIEGLAADAGAGVILSDTPENMPLIKKTGWFKKFSEISVKEISEEEALMYLSYIASIEEKKNEVMITVSALKRAVVLARENKKTIPSGAREYMEAGIELVKSRGGSEVSFAEVNEAEQLKKSLTIKTKKYIKK